MKKLSFRERFERQGLIQGIDPVQSGSREVVSLVASKDLRETKSVDAIIALRRRGASTLKAKRAVEAALERRANALEVPLVESRTALANDLRTSGFAVAVVGARSVDVRALRERLDLTQEQFALRFGLELDALRNWELGRRAPDTAAKSYLAVIDRAPDAVQAALSAPVI